MSVERFSSRTRAGWLLSLSLWADEAALVKWRTEESHHAAQLEGRNRLFDDYRLRVAQVVSREDGSSPSTRPQQPERRSAYNDIHKRRPSSVVLIDITLPGEENDHGASVAIDALTAAANREKAYEGGDVFESLAGAMPRRVVHLSSWRDEAAAMHWRDVVRTSTTLKGALTGLRWQMTVGEVERDYGRFDRATAPQFFAPVSATSASTSAAGPEVVRIEGYPPLEIALHHLAPADGRVDPGKVVLFVHGATFPSALAVAYRFDGHSWMDDLSGAGFDVWALDFAGYGGSDRYPEMREGGTARGPLTGPLTGPLGRADICSRQIAEAVRFISARQRVRAVSIVAHSWGTLPAGLYATQHAASVNRLVLFGPVTRRELPAASEKPKDAALPPAYSFVTIQRQRDRFFGYVPAGEAPVMEARHFDAWAPAYLASDPTSRMRVPPSVQVPSGPSSDVDAAWSGVMAYEPSRVTCPTLIIRGGWDSVTTNADAHWLYEALSACELKRDVVISRGTHVMHLERSRYQLYRETQLFLEGRDSG